MVRFDGACCSRRKCLLNTNKSKLKGKYFASGDVEFHTRLSSVHGVLTSVAANHPRSMLTMKSDYRDGVDGFDCRVGHDIVIHKDYTGSYMRVFQRGLWRTKQDLLLEHTPMSSLSPLQGV